MFYKKPGLPEESELVLCTVKKVLYHSVFASLDEYQNLEGMIHISEVSPGRIRNIRDFVKEGKKIVCKILKVNKEKKHIDLSLRRVSTSMRKKKNTEYKQEQKAEKILEILAKKLKTDMEDVYKKVGYKIIEEYNSLHSFFQSVIKDETILKKLNIPEKYSKYLLETIKEKVKLHQVSINKILNLSSNEFNGIDIIKSSLKKAMDFAKQKNYNLKVSYISAPKYNINVTSDDYKSAELAVNEIEKLIAESMKH